MVAALTQLHFNVDERGQRGFLAASVQEGTVLLEDGPVVLLLEHGELHVDDGFGQLRDRLLHVFLHTPQDTRRLR